ncbi:MAG: putative Tic20 family protein [Planctomycetota bacterium]|jgi:uncharacterized Tic20 family protein
MSDPTYPDSTTADDRNLAMLCHVGPLLVALFTAGGGGWLVPLVIWLMKREESPFVGDQAKESLNFHITLTVVSIAAWVSMITLILIPVAAVVLFCVWAGGIVFAIMAGIEASKGRRYRYPLTLRFLA